MSRTISSFVGFFAAAGFFLLCSAPLAHADNCGNGSIQGGEVCDEGGANSTQAVGCCAAGCASFVGVGTVCRPAAGGLCDTVAESCTGTSGTCPADIVSPNTVVCRPSLAGVCDSAENCTGSSPTCPADTFASNSTVCRPAAGVCDSVENCTGSTGACPGDAKSSAVCRPLQGICDVAQEVCDGSSNNCPADTAQNAGVVCRPSDGECDVAESCTGTSSSCPADLHKTSVCRASQGVCDLPESCDGTADHCPADAKSSAVCRPAVNPTCDVAESCNGVSNTCPDDVLVGCADNDGVDCTEAICLPNGSCAFAENCTEICRGQGFWKNHAGDEKGHPNLVQEILDQTGGLEICGVNVTETTTLGTMTSFLENICVLSKNNDTLKLDKVLATTAVNCAISEGGTCDQILEHLGFSVKYSDCSALCAGNPVQDGPTADECISELNCFNEGGTLIDGQCATGNCASDQSLCEEDEDCGEDIACVPFAGSCADAELCSDDLDAPADICPRAKPASSPRTCNEAKHNSCTALGGCF